MDSGSSQESFQTLTTTQEETAIATFDEAELLGIKTLLERGQFPKSQFVDLVNQGGPTPPEEIVNSGYRRAMTVSEQAAAREVEEAPPPAVAPSSSNAETRFDPSTIPRTEDYGPWRRVKHTSKRPPEYLTRPPAMAQDDLAEMLSEQVPLMINEQLQQQQPQPMDETSPRGDSSKRSASADASEQPEAKRRSSEEEAEDEDLMVEWDSQG